MAFSSLLLAGWWWFFFSFSVLAKRSTLHKISISTRLRKQETKSLIKAGKKVVRKGRFFFVFVFKVSRYANRVVG